MCAYRWWRESRSVVRWFPWRFAVRHPLPSLLPSSFSVRPWQVVNVHTISSWDHRWRWSASVFVGELCLRTLMKLPACEAFSVKQKTHQNQMPFEWKTSNTVWIWQENTIHTHTTGVSLCTLSQISMYAFFFCVYDGNYGFCSLLQLLWDKNKQQTVCPEDDHTCLPHQMLCVLMKDLFSSKASGH